MAKCLFNKDRPLNLSNYFENIKLTIHKADLSTEPIVNRIKTKYHGIEILNSNDYIMF